MSQQGFRNVEKVIAALGKKATAIDRRVAVASRLVAAAAVREVKMQIQGSHKRGTPTPSQPGHPPTNISGDLRRSIKSNVSRIGFATYKVEVGPTMIYGRAVELGNPNWGSGINYPYVAPAAKMLAKNRTLLEIYQRAVRDGSRA